MKGEEVARGPIVQALYQARLRTLLFSLRGCFAFWPPSWEWAGGMDQRVPGGRKVVSWTQAVTARAYALQQEKTPPQQVYALQLESNLCMLQLEKALAAPPKIKK